MPAGVRPAPLHSLAAAVLAAGPDAFGSHLSAAWVCGVMKFDDAPTPEISTPLHLRRDLRGVIAHRSGLLRAGDVVERSGVRIASGPLIAVQLSARLSDPALGAVVDELLRGRLATRSQLVAVLARFGPAPGRSPARLRRVLEARSIGVDDCDSVLEEYVFGALERFGLPLPECQVEVVFRGRRRWLDFVYLGRRLVLDPQGFEYHGGRARFDSDALRTNDYAIAGYEKLEFTSAFTDWEIARDVAEKLGVVVPVRPAKVYTYADWKRARFATR
jgi:hypothetical protein